jgi:hypothetical protein
MIFRTHACYFHSNLLNESLKSVGIGMPRDKNKGLHGNCLIGLQLGHAKPIIWILIHIIPTQASFGCLTKINGFSIENIALFWHFRIPIKSRFA